MFISGNNINMWATLFNFFLYLTHISYIFNTLRMGQSKVLSTSVRLKNYSFLKHGSKLVNMEKQNGDMASKHIKCRQVLHAHLYTEKRSISESYTEHSTAAHL